MTDIRKYVEGKTQEELVQIQRDSVVGGDIYKAVTFEIQKIQQDTNNIQIANLIDEVKKLKGITDSNARDSAQNTKNSMLLSKIAIWIAVVAIITQVAFSIHEETDCSFTTLAKDPNFMQFQHCYRTFDFGIFGSHSFKSPDILRPLTSESNWPVLFRTQPK